ncbi:MAG TPA: choice-of-anchor E domain-containing protein [Bryobacteraceae bacterium]|nr:choice-of-anchor E domain-containing protein [Bryobacteraceae bacterium]
MKARHLFASLLIGLFLLCASAQAQSILSYYAAIPKSATNWTPAKDLQLPGFDASLGTLTEVKLTYSAEIWQTLFAENLSAGSTATYDLTTTATFTLGRADGPTLINNSASPTVFHQTGSLGTYDYVPDFGGTSGITLNQDTVISGLYLDPNLAAYVSLAPIDFSATALATSTLVMHGGTGSDGAATAAAATLRVDYTYAAIPEPGAYGALLGLAALGMIIRRRRAA